MVLSKVILFLILPFMVGGRILILDRWECGDFGGGNLVGDFFVIFFMS